MSKDRAYCSSTSDPEPTGTDRNRLGSEGPLEPQAVPLPSPPNGIAPAKALGSPHVDFLLVEAWQEAVAALDDLQTLLHDATTLGAGRREAFEDARFNFAWRLRVIADRLAYPKPTAAQLVVAESAKAEEARTNESSERCYECGGRHSHLRCDGSGFALKE